MTCDNTLLLVLWGAGIYVFGALGTSVWLDVLKQWHERGRKP